MAVAGGNGPGGNAFVISDGGINLIVADIVDIAFPPTPSISYTNSAIVISWTAVPGAAYYNIYRGTSSGTETLYLSVPGAGYPDTAVAVTTNYYYKVTAVNGNGESAQSAEVVGNLPYSSLQFLLDNSIAGQQYTTDGAVNLVAASSQNLTSSTLPTTTGPLTFAIWFNATAISGQQGLVDSSSGGFTLQLFSSTIHWTVNNSATQNISGTLLSGTNYRVVGTYDGTNINLYINGVLVSGPTASTQVASSGTFRVGGSSGVFFGGTLSGLTIFSRAWSQAEVTADYNSGKGTPSTTAGLIAVGISTAGAVSGYPFTNPTISAAGIGKDYIGSNNITPQASPTYVAGPVTGTVLVSGDAVACPISQVATVTGGAVGIVGT